MYFPARSDWSLGTVEMIRNNSEIGHVIDLDMESNGPPCLNLETVKKFNLEEVCHLHHKISRNKEAFLNLMKYTKQSPVYLEDNDEYQYPSTNTNGYIMKNIERVGIFIE